MRDRSNSAVRLDYFQRVVNRTILRYQNPVTGLLPATPDHEHAWVRDNLYSILAVWGLALAYKKTADVDEDLAKAYELEQSTVKLMRGLLQCMMRQVHKLERFKHTQSPNDSLHAKYSVSTGEPVVGDEEWGHLQIDATSLYLLTLAQMTVSGLNIIHSRDEVAFIQNLVFYIEAAYRIPDYGVWERGDKTNKGVPELNSSSVGMAKAALEAMNELDLFGARGGPDSVIYVLTDETQQCEATLQSMLPRESYSKEIDSSLMSIISFPAFAVDDASLIEITRDEIVNKLEGRYGCKRFLRDGYRTAREDPNRLYYESWELKVFENIECEWPVFFAYLIIDGLFNKNEQRSSEYTAKLDDLIVIHNSMRVVPELYTVPEGKIEAEYRSPGSQERQAVGKIPHMWGQSLYILSRLLSENFLSPGELDPLNRRLVAEPKPDLVVQVVILAEDEEIKDKLAEEGLTVQTLNQVSPIQVLPAKALSFIYSMLGKNTRLGLSGRPSHEVGLLATSKLYTINESIFAFLPQLLDQHELYLVSDVEFLADMFRTNVAYLKTNWKMIGRPTVIIPISHLMLGDLSHGVHPSLIATVKKLQSGYLHGTRVLLGQLADFVSTSCVTQLHFVTDTKEHRDTWTAYVSKYRQGKTRSRLYSGERRASLKFKSISQAISGMVKRTKSIYVDRAEFPSGYFHELYDRNRRSSILSSDSEPPADSGSGGSGLITPESTDGVELAPRGTTSPRVLRRLKPGVLSGSSMSSSLPSSPGAIRSSGEQRRSMQTSISSKDETMKQYQNIDSDDLVEMLIETESIYEQVDILSFLYLTKGLDYDTGLGRGSVCTVSDLLTEVYEKAGSLKQWWLVRHIAGMLAKRVEDLAKAVTDLLVRQKQLSVGLPPVPRERIIVRPQTPEEISTLIFQSCGDDLSMAMLTQELLIYLAMFIRTEAKLFNEMLRLRIGLIIQVMAEELGISMNVGVEEGYEQLLNLSPFEMKTLLHHILSGKEFGVQAVRTLPSSVNASGDTSTSVQSRVFHVRPSIDRCTIQPSGQQEICVSSGDGPAGGEKISVRMSDEKAERMHQRRQSHFFERSRQSIALDNLDPTVTGSNSLEEQLNADRQGQWLRRRRLDGSLNRVPEGFYPKIWKALQKCHGMVIGGNLLSPDLTREMTLGEWKFALTVESTLNQIPEPEYRQLLVEALMVITIISEGDAHDQFHFNQQLVIDSIVYEGNSIFLHEQKISNGDSTECCVSPCPHEKRCNAARGICENFYDSAPSGRFGTMTYLCKAVSRMFNYPVQHDGDSIDCTIS